MGISGIVPTTTINTAGRSIACRTLQAVLCGASYKNLKAKINKIVMFIVIFEALGLIFLERYESRYIGCSELHVTYLNEGESWVDQSDTTAS